MPYKKKRTRSSPKFVRKAYMKPKYKAKAKSAPKRKYAAKKTTAKKQQSSLARSFGSSNVIGQVRYFQHKCTITQEIRFQPENTMQQWMLSIPWLNTGDSTSVMKYWIGFDQTSRW